MSDQPHDDVNPWPARAAEMAAIFMIGDGLLGLLQPRRHVDLWDRQALGAERLVAPFHDRPGRRRLYALAQIGAGLALGRDSGGAEYRSRSYSAAPERDDIRVNRAVVASVAKQSSVPARHPGLPRRFAPRNDDSTEGHRGLKHDDITMTYPSPRP